MGDDWTEITSVTDATGKRITVGHASDYVRVAVLSGAGGVVLAAIVLGAEERDQFIKGRAEAERRAEAWAAEHG
jgi:hypothetical protein